MAYKRISPQPVVEGGTGVQSNTAYAVLCAGTSSTGPIQSVASAGTTGQILTSNGASSLPTFQDNQAELVLLNTQTASGSADIVFDNTYITNAYTSYVAILDHLIPSAASPNLQMTFSVDNGSSYLSTNYAAGFQDWAYNTTTITNTNSTTYIPLTGTDASTNLGINMYLNFFGLNSSDYPTFSGFGSYAMTSAPSITFTSNVGYNYTTSGVDAIKFYFSSGNIASGTISLYGRLQ